MIFIFSNVSFFVYSLTFCDVTEYTEKTSMVRDGTVPLECLTVFNHILMGQRGEEPFSLIVHINPLPDFHPANEIVLEVAERAMKIVTEEKKATAGNQEDNSNSAKLHADLMERTQKLENFCETQFKNIQQQIKSLRQDILLIKGCSGSKYVFKHVIWMELEWMDKS